MMKNGRTVWRVVPAAALTVLIGLGAAGCSGPVNPDNPDNPDNPGETLDDFVLVPAGKFTMGSPGGTPNSNQDERPTREVTLSAFHIGKYTVTQGEYQAVMGNNPSYFKGEKRPVDSVCLFDALIYANRLSVFKGLTPVYEMPNKWPNPESWSSDPATWGEVPISVNDMADSNYRWERARIADGANGYRLPTEAQWEYAARGGNGSPGQFTYSGSNDVREVGWHYGNSENETYDVGWKKPNALGLYDMSGNVREWVWDFYSTYPDTPQTDPAGPPFTTTMERRILRGGSYNDMNTFLRSACRADSVSFERNTTNGLRLVRP